MLFLRPTRIIIPQKQVRVIAIFCFRQKSFPQFRRQSLARGMRKKIKKIKNSSFSGSTLFLALLFIYFSFATFLFIVFSFVSFLCGNVIFLLRALWEEIFM
jgi:uncharacterized membrane protein